MMYARSTTITADAAAIDDGIRNMRERTMPELMQIDGCVGLSLLVDRGSGRCIATTAWESEDAMRASENAVQSVRSDAIGKFAASLDRVEHWEIAVLHREHAAGDGCCVRCSWLESPSRSIDASIEMFRSRVLQPLEDMDGFCSASLLVDRASGRAVAATAWDGRAAMEASRDGASRLRTETAEASDARIVEVMEFDLAIAHLRVPELT